MGSASKARPSDPSASLQAEPPASSTERSQLNETWSERRHPSVRETMATLPDSDQALFDFEPHDTIPAPPPLEDELSPTQESR